MLRFRAQENIAASSLSLSAMRTDVSPAAVATSPTGNVPIMSPGGANAGKASTDEERLMASVPAPEDTPDYDQSSPSDSVPARTSQPDGAGPPTIIPRPKLVEEGSSDARPPRTKTPEEILESKLAPAAVSQGELIQPRKTAAYIVKNQPLANIMRGSIETNSEATAAKDSTRKSTDSADAKDPTAAAPVIARGQSVLVVT